MLIGAALDAAMRTLWPVEEPAELAGQLLGGCAEVGRRREGRDDRGEDEDGRRGSGGDGGATSAMSGR